MNFEQLDKVAKLPGAMFTELKADSEESAGPSQSPQAESAGLISEDAAIQSGSYLDNSAAETIALPRQSDTAQPFQPGAQSFGSGPQGVKAGQLVSGKLATDVMDSVFPALCVYAVSAMGYNVRKSDLQLSADEKRTIAPVFQQYLDTLNINLNNPLYNLLFVLGAIYAAKIVEQLPTMERSGKRQSAVKQAAQAVTKATTEDARETLIKATIKARKKGREDAIKFLTSKGKL